MFADLEINQSEDLPVFFKKVDSKGIGIIEKIDLSTYLENCSIKNPSKITEK